MEPQGCEREGDGGLREHEQFGRGQGAESRRGTAGHVPGVAQLRHEARAALAP